MLLMQAIYCCGQTGQNSSSLPGDYSETRVVEVVAVVHLCLSESFISKRLLQQEVYWENGATAWRMVLFFLSLSATVSRQAKIRLQFH